MRLLYREYPVDTECEISGAAGHHGPALYPRLLQPALPGLLAISWSLLFHDYLPPASRSAGSAWSFCCCWGAGGICAGASPGWRSSRCRCSKRELFVGVTITSIVWALGVLLYMDKLPDTYRAAMMMLSSLILTGSAIMLFGSRRTLYGAVLPLGFAMLFELSGGNTQERIVSCMLAGICSSFCPPCCGSCGGIRWPLSTTVFPMRIWWPS